MRVRLRGPLGAEFELQHWPLASAGERERFHDTAAAAHFLRGIIQENSSSRALRMLLAEADSFAPVDEHELLRRFAIALVRGTIVALRMPDAIIGLPPLEQITASSEPEPASFAEPEHTVASEPSIVDRLAVIESPTFPADIDAVAIARVRREAARRGVPFCEECLKKAASG